MKSLAYALVALFTVGLAGCSAGEDHTGETPPAAVVPVGTGKPSPSAEPGSPPCGATGEQLTASPVAKCVGRFSGIAFGKARPENSGPTPSMWMHRTTEGCLLGSNVVLRTDGTATEDGVTGTWTGDELYFRTDIGDRIADFTRTEAQPSK